MIFRPGLLFGSILTTVFWYVTSQVRGEQVGTFEVALMLAAAIVIIKGITE